MASERSTVLKNSTRQNSANSLAEICENQNKQEGVFTLKPPRNSEPPSTTMPLSRSSAALGLCFVSMLSCSFAFSSVSRAPRLNVGSPASCSIRSSFNVARSPALRMSSASGVSDGEKETVESYQVPEHCRKLRIQKPLGVILEEVHDGKGAYVVTVNEGSNAAKAGVKVGELLVACSAATLKAGKEGAYANQGYGGRPFDNWELVMFPCIDTPFKNIMSALASNNERWGINDISVVLAPKREEEPNKD
eukprot:2280035-Rhodomonas_salina.3